MSTTSGDDDLPDEDDLLGSGWDCSELLDNAAAEEAGFSMQFPSDAVDFGHPDPPRLAVHPVFCREAATTTTTPQPHGGGGGGVHSETDEQVVLVVSYTEHCVVAQALQSGSSSRASPVLVIGSLPIFDAKGTDETIHCLTIVARESLDFLDNDDNDHAATTMDTGAGSDATMADADSSLGEA